MPFEYSDDFIKLVVSRCTESEFGGRIHGAILTDTVLPDISREFLVQIMEGRSIAGMKAGTAVGQFSAPSSETRNVKDER